MKKLPLSMALCFAVLMSCSTSAYADDKALDAAIQLKKSHVERFWQHCLERGGTETTCRDQLSQIHVREKRVLLRIMQHASDPVNKASVSCYSPLSTYADLVQCWEELADHLDGGGAPTDFTPPHEKNVNSWDKILEGLADLDAKEQRSIFLCIRGQVRINFDTTVAPNVTKGGGDAMWAFKVHAREHYLLSKLARAAGWADMADYCEVEATNAADFVRGGSDMAEFIRRSKANEALVARALASEEGRMSEHEAAFSRFHDLCERAATYIAGEAKAHATF